MTTTSNGKNGNNQKEIVAVFGGTGYTGQEFVPLALEKGYKVQVLARTPTKFSFTLRRNPHLRIIQGDFEDPIEGENFIRDTIRNAKYVVCLAGGKPGDPKHYHKLFLRRLVEKVWSMMQEDESSHVKYFLYQASVFCNLPDGTNLWPVKYFSRPVVANILLRIKPGIEDHDEVVKFLEAHQHDNNDKVKPIVIRPGALVEGKDGGKENEVLEASDHPPFFGGRAVTYHDLAEFNLRAMKDDNLVGKYPFVNVVH